MFTLKSDKNEMVNQSLNFKKLNYLNSHVLLLHTVQNN